MSVEMTRQGEVATVTISRPRALNALDADTLRSLRECMQNLAMDPPRVVVLDSAGDRVFVAGADIASMSTMTPEEAREFTLLGHAAFDAIERLPSIVLAVVQGAALGGGCELALACDLVIASEKARFGQPETNLGLIPGFGGCSRLLRRVGVAAARELVYTGRLVDAAEARTLGLVNRIVAPESLREEADAWAAELATRPPLACARAKVAMAAAETSDARSAQAVEVEAFAGLFGAADTREGLEAFLEKRPAEFKGL